MDKKYRQKEMVSVILINDFFYTTHKCLLAVVNKF